MSTVLIVTPIIIANWSLITTAITAAVGSLGYAIAKSGVDASRQTSQTLNRAEIEVADSEILAEAGGTGQEVVVERDDIKATFSRDARGALRVCVEGRGHSKSQLKQIGEELIGRVTQQYVYHRVVTELKQRNMTIVDEAVEADRTVKIRVRNW